MSSGKRDAGIAVRAYRFLLRAFPPEFRQVYGPDLEAVFREELRHLPDGPRGLRIRFWLATIWDTLSEGARERVARWSGRSPPPPPRRPLRETPPWSLAAFVETALTELRRAARSLARRPGFSAAVVLILAAGLAGATVGWTAVGNILLRPLGYAEEDRLVGVWQKAQLPDGTVRPRFAVSDAQIVGLRDRARALDEVAWINGATGNGIVLEREDAPPFRVRYARSSTNLFTLLGVGALHGRTFRPGDEERDVVLLSETAWSEYFGRDPGIVGRRVPLGSRRYEVVGVLPSSFRWLDFPERVEVWLPQLLNETRAAPFFFNVVARLRPEATPAAAEAEASGILLNVQNEQVRRLEDPPHPYATVVPIREAQLGEVGPQLEVLGGGVVLVLLIAIVNVALLLLIRVAGRAHDGAVRAALGGGPGRVAAPVLAEAFLLTGAAWLLALGGTAGALEFLRTFAPEGIPRIQALGFSWQVMTASAVLALVVALLVSLLPAVLLRRSGVRAILVSSPTPVGEGALPRRLRGPLLVAEVALAMVLLSGAGLMIHSLMELRQADLGFETEDILQGKLTLPTDRFWTEVDGRIPGGGRMLRIDPALEGFRAALRERLAAHPGVLDVSLAKHTPLGGRYGGFTPFVREGREDVEMPPGESWISHNAVDPDFLPFIGARLLEGRWLTEADDENAPPVALVSEALARRFWPGESPLGDRFRSGGWVADGEDGYRQEHMWVTVVGVVASLREWEYRSQDETVYRPLPQDYPTNGLVPAFGRGPLLSLFVRYRGDPAEVAPHIRAVVAELLPGVPVDELRTMDGVAARWLREPRFYTGLLSAFGALAVVLAAGGIAAVVGYGVSRRRREIGLRIALGAWTGEVMRLVTRETLVLVAVGLAAGLGASLLLGLVLESLLFEVAPRDALTLGASALLFTVVALLSAWIPARNALAVDPAEALRCE